MSALTYDLRLLKTVSLIRDGDEHKNVLKYKEERVCLN